MPTLIHVSPCLREHQQLTPSQKDRALFKGQNCESSGIGLFESSGRGFYYKKPIFFHLTSVVNLRSPYWLPRSSDTTQTK
jgi:hypothetical protein